MGKDAKKKSKGRKPEADVELVLIRNAANFSMRIVGEVFTPILKCVICGRQTEHHFVEIRKAPFMRYVAGVLNPIPRFDKWSKAIEMDIDLWACSVCKTERVYGSA